MLENLLQMIREVGQEQVVENRYIPDEHNEEVMAVAGESVVGGLQQALASGRFDDLFSMFQTNSSAQIMSSPVAQDIQTGFVENISNRLGIDSRVAKGLAATMIPIIISKLVKRTNSPADQDSGFSLEGLIGSLIGGGQQTQQTGGQQFNIGDLIRQFTGGGQQMQPQPAGGMDFEQLIRQFTGGGQQAQPQTGGLETLIRGFFGRG